MQLLVQNCLGPSHATEIFSAPKRRIFALPKIVRYRNRSGLQYTVNVVSQGQDMCAFFIHHHEQARNVRKSFRRYQSSWLKKYMWVSRRIELYPQNGGQAAVADAWVVHGTWWISWVILCPTLFVVFFSVPCISGGPCPAVEPRIPYLEGKLSNAQLSSMYVLLSLSHTLSLSLSLLIKVSFLCSLSYAA